MSLTLNAARALRDGGIDACAALDSALARMLAELPSEHHAEVKLAMARTLAAVMDETINKAVAAFAELSPDEETWREVVKSQAMKRAM